MPGPLSATVSRAPRPSVLNDRRDHGARRGVHSCVAQQVGQHLVQPRRVALDEHGFVGQIKVPVVVGPGDVGVGEGVDGQLGQVDLFTFERAAGVEARQQQQILDEVRHPLGLGRPPGPSRGRPRRAPPHGGAGRVRCTRGSR